jgi:hypothetical protein
MEPYRPRRTETLGVRERAGWRVKLIGITASGDMPGDEIIRAAFDATMGQLPQPVPPDGPTACVWELLAFEHERGAWVEHVLARPADPDLEGYLKAKLSI